MEEKPVFVTEPISTQRLMLQQPQGVPAAAVQSFYVENKIFHAPWEPIRDPSFYELDSIERMLDFQQQENHAGRGLYLYLQLHDAPQVIGTVALSAIVYGAFRSCFLGYRLARCETCHGYMSEAVRTVVELAFSRYRLHRVEANIMPANHASIRLVENLGFVNEGYSSRYLQIAGVWEGHCHYVMLNEALEQRENDGK